MFGRVSGLRKAVHRREPPWLCNTRGITPSIYTQGVCPAQLSTQPQPQSHFPEQCSTRCRLCCSRGGPEQAPTGHPITSPAPSGSSGLLFSLLFLPAEPRPAVPRSAGADAADRQGSPGRAGALSPSKGTNGRRRSPARPGDPEEAPPSTRSGTASSLCPASAAAPAQPQRVPVA